MTFVATNVLIDIFDHDVQWHQWSSDRMIEIAASASRLMVNLIVVGELAPGFASADRLLDELRQLSAEIMPLDFE